MTSKSNESLAYFEFELIPSSFEKSPNKADSALLNEICLLLGAKPKETFDRKNMQAWSCTLLWANMGPFHGIGSNKKEARNDASSKAIDYIFQKLAPFRKQWEFYHKADLPENFNLSKPDPVSTVFFIDLDSCTSIAPKLIQLCRTLQLQRVSCIGFANKLYNGSSLPKDIFVERAESTSKSSAAFILAYRAGIFAVKHRSVSWKPFIVLVSKDHGLTCVAQMLEFVFVATWINSTRCETSSFKSIVNLPRRMEEAEEEEKEPQAIAQHYDQRAKEDHKAARKSSKTLSLRNLNNWVKSVLIALHTRPGYSVLDLACGKGGDLHKWQKQQITRYVGCDISKESLKTAFQRYKQLKQRTFTAQFLCGDGFGCQLDRYLEPDIHFHVVSCQFSMHYAFSSEEKVRRMLENVTQRLVPGGFFIGTIPDSNVLVRKLRACPGLEFGNEFYRVVFDDAWSSKRFVKNPFGIRYHFYLESAVLDVPEYLVVFPVLEQMAQEYGLELQLWMNFHEFITMYLSPNSPFLSLFHRMDIFQNSRGKGQEEAEEPAVITTIIGLSPEFWDTAYLYAVFAFKKRGADPWLGLESVACIDNNNNNNQGDVSNEEEPIIYMNDGEEWNSHHKNNEEEDGRRPTDDEEWKEERLGKKRRKTAMSSSS